MQSGAGADAPTAARRCAKGVQPSRQHLKPEGRDAEAGCDAVSRPRLRVVPGPSVPHRTLRTPFVARWLPEEARGGEQRPDEPRIGETKTGGQPVPLLRLMGFPPTPDASGDLESTAFLAGQSVGLVQEIKPAAEVIRECVEGARHLLSQLAVG
ncbi:MAG TPA: hypothetical protein VHN13_20970 [Candidatus Tectomicrobia bacterium]|jgi:hypothetical protein|nr:hypothetical protein [Candidatus Tectomicrobia bacterium]